MKTKNLNKLAVAVAAVLGINPAGAQAAATDQYWKIDGTTGTWTGPNWGTSALGPFSTAWTSANNADFTASSTLTFATTTIGNVTVADGATVTVTAGGTLTLNTATPSIFNIGTNSTLTWTSQNVTANSTGGYTKSGAGILNLGALTYTTNMTGGVTLNAGTLVVSGDKALGNGALNLNGGTLQSSGTRSFAPTSISFGGDFGLSGTGNATFAATVGLGASTRTITNATTSGSRIFSGLISGGAGAGLTFIGSGAGQIYIGNASNSFSGPISITGGEVGFASDGALGTGTSITVDGGRLTSSSTAGNAVTSTWSASRNIMVGSAAGTSISVQSGTGDLTYNGVISDVTGETGAWAKQGGGILRLGGQSTYSGSTSINNGIVQITTGNDRLPTGTVVNIGQAASSNVGTFDLNGNNQTIAGLVSTTGTNAAAVSNTVTTSTTPATLTINTAGSNSYAFSDGTAATSGIITGGISLVKNGTGTQSLGGVNTYTGTTSINNGKLRLTGSLTSAVTVGNNTAAAAIFSGTGTTTGLVTTSTIGSNVAYLAPGVNVSGTRTDFGTAGALHFNNGLTIGDGTQLDYDFGANTAASDSIAMAGALTLGNNVVLNVNDLGIVTGTGYTLISGATGLTGGGNLGTWSAVGAPGGSTAAFTLSGNDVVVTFNGGAPTTTATTYSLAAVASNNNVLVNKTTAVNSTITNTGNGTADTLSYTGLNASATGGTITGSTKDGGPLAQGANDTNTGLTYNAGATSGTYSITPTVASTTNGTLGGSASSSGTAPQAVTVFDAAALSGSGLNVANAAGSFRASASVTSESLSGQTGFTATNLNGTKIDAGSSVAAATFDSTGKLNGTYHTTATIGFNDLTSGSAAIAGGTGDSANNVVLSASVSGKNNTGGATVLAGQSYTGYGLGSTFTVGTTATLLDGKAGTGNTGGTSDGADHTVNMAFSDVGAHANNVNKLSDVLTLTGTNTDKFVLQLTYTGTPAQGTPFLAYYSATYGGYVNAIAGNSAGNTTPFGGTNYGEILGAYDPASEFILGDYGFDSVNHTAWAVLDHNSDYEVIPESSTWASLAAGLGTLMVWQRGRRRRTARVS